MRKFFNFWNAPTPKSETDFGDLLTEQIGYRDNSQIVSSFLQAGQNLYDYRFGQNSHNVTYDYDESFDGDDWKSAEDINVCRSRDFDEIDAMHYINRGLQISKEIKEKKTKKK